MSGTFEGLLFPHAETGTEGWLWALQENYQRPYWSYEDLHILENGNGLIIYDPSGQQVWSGTISFCYNPNYETENIHYKPTNFDWDEWIKIFAAGNVGRDEDYSKSYTGKLIVY